MTEKEVKEFVKLIVDYGNKPLNEMQKEIIKQCVDKAQTPQELLAILVMYKGLF